MACAPAGLAAPQVAPAPPVPLTVRALAVTVPAMLDSTVSTTWMARPPPVSVTKVRLVVKAALVLGWVRTSCCQWKSKGWPLL